MNNNDENLKFEVLKKIKGNNSHNNERNKKECQRYKLWIMQTGKIQMPSHPSRTMQQFVIMLFRLSLSEHSMGVKYCMRYIKYESYF